MHKEQEVPLEPYPTPLRRRKLTSLKESYPWFGPLMAIAAVTSVAGLVILFLLLAVPISMLAVGVRYRDWHYCPIEPRISQFLIVGGAVSLTYMAFIIIVSLITMFLAFAKSFAAIICIAIVALVTIVTQVFLFIWLIVGSVWTFSVRNRVVHVHESNFYPMTYCDKTLYQFTFAYLIIVYVLMALQCCYRCFNGINRSKQQA